MPNAKNAGSKKFLSFDYEYKILILVVQFILIFSKTKIKTL